jgi:hypothetical protein
MLRVKEAKFEDSTVDTDGALVMRFQATGRKTGPVWQPGQFLTDLPGGFIITVYPDGTAVLVDEADATESRAIQDAAREPAPMPARRR